MLILNASQIRDWDAYTIANEPISPDGLMERASNAFVSWFVRMFNTEEKIGIVCGKGNNGGDGMVIGRLLSARRYNVTVFKLEENTDINLDPFTVLIDAIFGSGLNRPVQSPYSDIIKKLNSASATRIAVDVPSGLQLDVPSTGEIVRADYTVTFQVPKLPFMFPQYAPFVGDWTVVDIGLHADYLNKGKVISKNIYIDPGFTNHLIGKRSKFAHKGLYGHALLVAGSVGKMGASVLAAKAALRSGVGLLTVHVPKSGYNIIQTSVPEAMATIDSNEDYFSDAGDASNYNVIGIGPGLGVTASTVGGLRKLLQAGKPMVLDADALNILAGSRELMHLIPGGSILTPHPGEFKRLVGEWKDDFHRLDLQRELAKKTRSIIILKGAHTSIASPDGTVWFNSSGNPGMAKGGSGDVLTGVLTGLLAQKHYQAAEAAIIGVYHHGVAGDLAAGKMGENSVVAGDIVEFLGQSFSR